MKRISVWLGILVCFLESVAPAAMEYEVRSQCAYERTGLFEFAPQMLFLSQEFPVNGATTQFRSHFNPGAVIRFTPVWRDRYPLYFHFGGQKITEVNDAGVTVQGEHNNVKYVWTFGARIGFHPFESHRFILASGLMFNHEAFLRTLDATNVHLNKVLIPTYVLSASVEYYREAGMSLFFEVQGNASFSVPMDYYLIRNGIGLTVRPSARWRLDGYQLGAALIYDRLDLNTTVGNPSVTQLGLEVSVAWGDNT